MTIDDDGTADGADQGGAGTPFRETDDGPGRTIPTTTVPDAVTGEPVQVEDTRWWFIGFALAGVLVLLIALGFALL
jgi:hypothetical protein